MGFLKKFRRFLKGESPPSKDFNSDYSSRLSSPAPTSPTRSSENLQYPPRESGYTYPGERSNQNTLSSQQTLTQQRAQQNKNTQSIYEDPYTQKTQRRDIFYERENAREQNTEEILAAKLQTLTAQNQTIIELLKEINMNLSYKVRR